MARVPTPPPARGPFRAEEQSSAAWAIGVPPELVARRVAELVPERPEPYLDVEAAAKYLSAARSRIYELVERRAVAVHRDGRRLLFRASDLDAHLQREEAR